MNVDIVSCVAYLVRRKTLVVDLTQRGNIWTVRHTIS